VSNALAAVAVARILGMQYKDIASRLARFSFPPGRLNFIELNNTRFIDDTYNSNPASLKLALEALDRFEVRGRKIVVMADMLELGTDKDLFHEQAGREIARICDALITVGTLSRIVADSAARSGIACENIFTCETSRQARDILFRKLIPGPDDIVLVKGSHAMKMEKVFTRFKKI
jgi:UDP-N-acetylmuramyl pentapeptide synthase